MRNDALHKLTVLKQIADAFRKEGISYAVGASCMLYMRGIIEDFHDIDILVVREDHRKACSILDGFAEEQIPEHRYSEYYKTYLFEDTEIDLIGEFILQGEDRSLHREDRIDEMLLQDAWISVDTADRWLRNYRLMDRQKRVKQLEEYFHDRPIDVKASFGAIEFDDLCTSLQQRYPTAVLNREKLRNWYDDPEIFLYTMDESRQELLVLYPIQEEHYAEAIRFLCRDTHSAECFMRMIEEKYPDWDIDVSFCPQDDFVYEELGRNSAVFDPVQIEMINSKETDISADAPVILYDERYESSYRLLHDDERYWTADKVLAEPSFEIFLILEGEECAAYLDLMRGEKEDFIYDVFVREKSRGRGYGKALAKAASLYSGQGRLRLSVDIDNQAAIRAYTSAGFVSVEGSEMQYAHIHRKEE